MRTIAVHPSADMYGSDRVFLESVKVLSADVLCILPDEGPLTQSLTSLGISYRAVPFPVLRRIEMKGVTQMIRFAADFLTSIPRLVALLRAHRCDLLYVSTIVTPGWVIAGRLAGCRVVCHVHESEPGMSRMASRLLLTPLLLANRVLANSWDTHNWLSESLRMISDRTRVLYNGVAPTGPRATRVGSSGAKRLVLVGRLSHRKGQDVAIRALSLLRDRGWNAELTIVGDAYRGYEGYVEELHALIEAVGLQRHVYFAGYQDPVHYLDAADVALVPSRIEPFGLVAAEALMQGVPTIASDVGGLREIIRDHSTGRLVRPDDPAALADAIADLLQNPDTANQLGAAGRADVLARFSSTNYPDRLMGALS